jgi:RimJ/RimL family protein N-acetyltransferase
MEFETKRLRLRPWVISDAESCYEYASNPQIGPNTGWSIHNSVEHSKDIIKRILAIPETYAVCLKEDNRAIGSISLMIGEKSNIKIASDEAEIGYWLGVAFWGQGLIPEAVQCLMEYAFHKLQLQKLWCGYFDGNEKSKRVQDKCGFKYQYTLKDKEWPLINEIKTEHISCITKTEYLNQ